MKVTAVLIPFFLATASLLPTKNSNQLSAELNDTLLANLASIAPLSERKKPIELKPAISINTCILKNITLDSLNSTLLEKKLKETQRHRISVSLDSETRCALKVSKNKTTGKFNFEYNKIPVMLCLNQNSVICNTDSNCSTALKCCEHSLPCTNAILIKQIQKDQIHNFTSKVCSYSNKTSCYDLVPANVTRYPLPTEKNAEASVLAVNPVAYFYITLLNTFIYFNLIK